MKNWLHPTTFCKDADFNVVLASPLGGQPPIDPKSELADFQTDDTRKFDQDATAQAKGGVYQKGDDWGSFAVEDGLIITGQNPASSAAAEKRLVNKLNPQ